MPAPSTPHNTTSFSPYRTDSNTTFRNPPLRSPILLPPRNPEPYTPPIVQNKNERKDRKIEHYAGEGDIGAKKWASKHVESFKAAYDVGKPVLESSVMVLLSMLFLMFVIQLLLQGVTTGQSFWKRSG